MGENRGKLIGDNIRSILKRTKKTQAWLAGETGIPAGYLSELMNGNPRKRWNEDTLGKVANTLGVPLSEIMPSSKEDSVWQQRISAYNALEEKKKQEFEAYWGAPMDKYLKDNSD